MSDLMPPDSDRPGAIPPRDPATDMPEAAQVDSGGGTNATVGGGDGDGSAVEGQPGTSATTSEEGVTAELWAFRFRDPIMAQEALLAAMRLQGHDDLDLDDAAIVTRDDRGRIRINQTRDVSATQGAVSGSWLGLLAGLFVPGGALVGMALGAAAGGLFGKLHDKGINDNEMKQWGEELDSGEAALFLLVEDCHPVLALHEVARFPATVLTSTGSSDMVARVRDRLAADPWGR